MATLERCGRLIVPTLQRGNGISGRSSVPTEMAAGEGLLVMVRLLAKAEFKS